MEAAYPSWGNMVVTRWYYSMDRVCSWKGASFEVEPRRCSLLALDDGLARR